MGRTRSSCWRALQLLPRGARASHSPEALSFLHLSERTIPSMQLSPQQRCSKRRLPDGANLSPVRSNHYAAWRKFCAGRRCRKSSILDSLLRSVIVFRAASRNRLSETEPESKESSIRSMMASFASCNWHSHCLRRSVQTGVGSANAVLRLTGYCWIRKREVFARRRAGVTAPSLG